MGFNRYSAYILIQIVLISITGGIFIWTLGQDYLVVSSYTFGLALALETGVLFYYLHRTQRSLQLFLDSARQLDAIAAPSIPGMSISKLNLSYNEIVDLIRESRLNTEIEHQYFRNTLENIQTGIITFDPGGRIDICNKAAREILRVEQVQKLQDISNRFPGLVEEVKILKPNQHKLIKLFRDEERLVLSLRCSDIQLAGRSLRLVSLQNIRQEVEEEEVVAWQKLIRVLTHEIMNSISPVKSLTHSLINLFEKNGVPVPADDITDETTAKCLTALKAIDNRNKGLMQFVESYRSLTRIPEPVFQSIQAKSWLENCILIMQGELLANAVTCSLEISPRLVELSGDEKLLSQVIINLVKNAIEALAGNMDGVIRITAMPDKNGSPVIEVLDNGKGFSLEDQDKIFIPFYSTKEGGSGIGLSLARQIMRLHGGTISARSVPAKGTSFSLAFQ